jgi:nicotinamide phosphoribosyltransferase
MSFKINSLYLSDGYKVGHKKMLAKGTTKLYGTWIPRSTKHAPKGVTKIVSFGQQLVWKWLHDEFEENFFFTKENQMYNEAAKIVGLQETLIHIDYKEKALQFTKDMSLYLGMEYDGKHFEELWDLGYLPIKVKALPEGIETGTNIPHMTFINTVDGFAWLTLYLETVVSSLAWKPSTAATIAKLYRRQAEEWVAKTDPSNMWLVDFMCHDFSARGLDPMSQYLIGLGHASSFKGSDTLPVIPAARYFYGVKEDEMPIYSVNASEHSVSTTKIFTVGEQQMIADWLEIFPKGILSIVADTFDLWKLITEYLPANKEAIMARDGKLVIRPDSGDPVDIICGLNIHEYESLDIAKDEFEDDLYSNQVHGKSQFSIDEKRLVKVESKYYKLTANVDWNRYDKQYYYPEDIDFDVKEVEPTPASKGVIELLWDIFGGTVNEQGYKVLDPHIGAIYGDSITPERQVQIYERLAAKGFASTNIVLGVGSFTYQYNTRDTLGFAAKGAWFEVEDRIVFTNKNGNLDEEFVKTAYNIYKDPITDDGTKKSLKGLIQVFEQTYNEDSVDEFTQIEVKTECNWEEETQGLLQVIYEDGKFFNQVTLNEIRERLQSVIGK